MRQFSFIATLLLFALPLFSATYTTPNTGVDWTMNDLVSNSNGTVTGTFPNYNILDSVIIAPNDRLTIPAGSILTFTQNGLVVRGKLLAIGTPTSRIIFTGATPTPASWRNIRIEDSAIDTACIFRHCVIEYSTGGIACISSSPTIEFSTLRFNGSLTLVGGSTAIQCFNSNAIIRHDSLYNNSQSTITISNNSNPIIEHNYIANNNVRNQSPVNPITISFQGNNNPIIRFNEIHSADIPQPVRAGGISVGLGSNTTVQNPLIEFNYIHDCAFGIVIAGATQCVVRNNRIENNTRNPNPLQAGSGINVNSSGSAVAAPIITGNFIKGNLWGVTIQGTAQPNLGDLSNTTPDDDGRNTFIDNLQGTTNYALYNNSQSTITISNNSNPIIEHNYIANNNVRNQSPVNPITISFQGNNNPIIRFNEIHSADIPQPVRAGGISVGLGSNTTVQNPLIEFNYIHDCAFGIVIAGATQCVVRNNRIENNTRNPNPLQAGSGINVNSSGSAVAAPIITGNFIKGNLWGVTIQGTAQPNLGDLSNTTPDDDGRNTFIDNLQGTTNYALYNNTSNTVRAQNNFWGTTDLALIQERIWGAGDIQNPPTVIFTPFALGDISLPVELVEFLGRKTQNAILLSWKTASELNNAGFEVQRRSENREASHEAWQVLGFVRGRGTTTDAQSYSFLDKTASGIVQYRLKQIDFDGRFAYSTVIEVDAGTPKTFVLEQNYPNPFNPTTILTYQLPVATHVKLEVFDMLGRKVATLVNEAQSAGTHRITFNASGLSSGVYFYRLNAGNFSSTQKMMLLK